jgi:hypothetical protein
LRDYVPIAAALSKLIASSPVTNYRLGLTDHKLDVIHLQFAPDINQLEKPLLALQIAS